MPQDPDPLTRDVFLATLMANVAVAAILATMLARFHWFRRILLTERRDWPERLVFAAGLGVPLTLGVAARLVLHYEAADLTLSGAFLAGLIAGPGLGVYKVTKHAVVTLSETLHHDLAMRGARIGVSILCPEWVSTRIMESARNRPPALQNDPAAEQITPELLAAWQYMTEAVQSGMSPAEVAAFHEQIAKLNRSHPAPEEYRDYLAHLEGVLRSAAANAESLRDTRRLPPASTGPVRIDCRPAIREAALRTRPWRRCRPPKGSRRPSPWWCFCRAFHKSLRRCATPSTGRAFARS